jgi:hypothetical protein
MSPDGAMIRRRSCAFCGDGIDSEGAEWVELTINVRPTRSEYATVAWFAAHTVCLSERLNPRARDALRDIERQS